MTGWPASRTVLFRGWGAPSRGLRDVGFHDSARLSPELLPFHSLLALHHHRPQDPVDSRLVTWAPGLEPVHHLAIHAQRDPLLARRFQRDSAPASSSASRDNSSDPEACSRGIRPVRNLRFLCVPFLGLDVMTELFCHICQNNSFHAEHFRKAKWAL